jgi:hypothetical protein
MIKIINKVTLVMLIVFVSGCGGKKNTPEPAPIAAVLKFPDPNSACTTGIVVSDTKSTVTFTWNASANADNYELKLKNLLTNEVSTNSANTTELAITISRNTPYSWYVISKSSKATASAQSDVWKFYNSGVPTVSHPPFAADVAAPGFGQNVTAVGGMVNLSWTASDLDNDIKGYDVYFGTTVTPPLLKSNVTDMFLKDVIVTAGTTYYWRVTTKDLLGNASESGVFQFKVN